MANFVDAPGARTYVAHMKTAPDFHLAAAATSRDARKTMAFEAISRAANQTEQTLVPKLEALKGQGLLTSYEVLPGTGAVVLNVPQAKAGAAYDALQGVSELGRMVRNREVTLDDKVGAVVPGAAAGTPEYNVGKVEAPAAWAAGTDGKGVVVGMVDTGADTTHEALKDHFRGTNADGTQTMDYNWYDSVGGKATAYDDHGHGSHTAGTAVGGTADHVIGMAPGAKFIATKVFNKYGSSDTATILRGLNWMLAPTDAAGKNADPTKAPDLISNSWGNSNGSSLSYLDSLKAFDAAGIVPVFAAGNSGPGAKTIGAPGSYAQAISIGATDANDKVASFSSRGPSPIKGADGKELQKPDVSAPGVNVVSAKPGGGYQQMSGTSMATPGVAGVVALLLSKYPTLTNEQVRTALQQGSVDLGPAGWDADYGFGRVSAPKALAAAAALVNPAPTPPPAA